MVRVSMDEFLADTTGAKFADVANDPEIDFQGWLKFFNNEKRQIRMQDSEEHHLRPALAGVIRELERNPSFESYLSNGKAQRGKQALGVLTRMIMQKMGWRPMGRKGSLGQCLKTNKETESSGFQENTSGLSRWFKKAEHYERVV